MITRAEEALQVRVPNREGEVSEQPLWAALAPGLVGGNDQICIRGIPGRRIARYRTVHRARFIPTVLVSRPFAYLITEPSIAEKLRHHNVELHTLTEPVDQQVEAYVVVGSEKTDSPDICTSIERFETVLTARLERRRVRFPAGTLVVPTAQRLGNLVVYLLEPESDDGLARWEFFDRAIQIGQPFPAYRVMTPTKLPTRRA